AGQVDGDDLVPGLDRNVAEVALRVVDAGAVDQDVDVAVALEDRLRRLRHLFMIRDVERDRLAAARRLELLLTGKQGFPASSGDDDVSAGFGELDAAGQADTRTAAGDPGDLTA